MIKKLLSFTLIFLSTISFSCKKNNENNKKENREIGIHPGIKDKKIEIIKKIIGDKSLDDISPREAYTILEKIYKEI